MPSLEKPPTHLSYQDIYPCPVCRLGQIEALTLMEAMSCNFCNHIFTANLEKQQLKMADRHPPLIWRWKGRTWTGAHVEGIELGWVYWFLAGLLIISPPTLVGLGAYIFPPLPGSALSWIPLAWTGLAFLLHLFMVGWLVVQFYQFPVLTYLRIRGQRLFAR